MDKRIVIFLPDLRGGGAECLHVNLANDWVKRRYKVTFVLMQKRGELLALLPREVSIIELGTNKIRGSLKPLILYLRTHRPNVLLTAMWPLTIIAIAAHRLAGKPGRIIISDHAPLSLLPETQGWFKHLLLRISIGLVYPLADKFVAVSSGVADDLSHLGRIDRQRIKVIYNPAARGQLNRIQRFPEPWNGAEGKRIITVGNLKPEKDHALLIKAFALVRKKINANLMILGEGELRQDLKKMITELNLKNSVRMPGFLLDPYPFYQAADLFVLSSRYEGFGNVLVEAMECGLSVVSTDCKSGPSEILNGGQYGRLVPVGDVRALAEAILLALKEPSPPEQQMKRAAEFSIERAATAYLNLFENAN
jgi:glycosyltransferase involved in cell wall biosynthesis